ncbi:MAG: glycosyltransferase family 2 protein, partial [Verrucomicrobiae bacterium]|nr:glycosyltransferase family 2 protein [Verrucomicrobiae bacterium]
MSVIFWLSLMVVGYTYVGYPVLLRGIVEWRQRTRARRLEAEERLKKSSSSKTRWTKAETSANSGKSQPEIPPAISIILAAYNEANRIEERIQNLAQCDYAGERELIVICGGCTDDTAERARRWSGEMTVRVIEKTERRSKAVSLNEGVAEARGEILVFADARQRFNRHAIRKLVAAFADPEVAGVSGNLEIAASEDGAGAGIDAYWKLERLIRKLESDLDSVIGCTGAIYALRRSAFEPLPEDTILDDVVIPMHAVMAGHRVLFESDAIAFDPQNLSPDKERRRKIRTLAGNYQMLFRYPEWLSPMKNRTWWQVISHKYLRLAGPFFLAACLLSSAWLARESFFYRLAFLGQLFCYGLAAIGMIFRGIRS